MTPEPAAVPGGVAEQATDERALYSRGDERAIFSVRAERALIVKGWRRERPETPREEYLESRKGRPLSVEEAQIAARLQHE